MALKVWLEEWLGLWLNKDIIITNIHGNNTHLKNEGNGLNTGNFSDDSLYDVTSIIIGYYHAVIPTILKIFPCARLVAIVTCYGFLYVIRCYRKVDYWIMWYWIM